jgi:F0F1-type ATP synthase assembly protein I
MSHAGRIVVVQALLGAVCSAGFFTASTHSGTSAVLALLSSGIPSAYYAWVQARTYNATRLLLHGVLKMMLTLVFMMVCIVRVGIDPLAFFVTFAVMQLGYLTRQADKAGK